VINPTPKDIGRKVRLPIFGAQPMQGVLVEVLMEDMATPHPFARVKFPDMRQPVLTDIEKLDWAE
jgi:hypothetical protein